ncbi:MAG: hypothetical protein M3082_08555, partial [Candidatus Dormibacteraeota bacterium]|nr:hypothetical protein [Candidatus Dormibacteraeota bacterium]
LLDVIAKGLSRQGEKLLATESIEDSIQLIDELLRSPILQPRTYVRIVGRLTPVFNTKTALTRDFSEHFLKPANPSRQSMPPAAKHPKPPSSQAGFSTRQTTSLPPGLQSATRPFVRRSLTRP